VFVTSNAICIVFKRQYCIFWIRNYFKKCFVRADCNANQDEKQCLHMNFINDLGSFKIPKVIKRLAIDMTSQNPSYVSINIFSFTFCWVQM
jgi:hypothetical protein